MHDRLPGLSAGLLSVGRTVGDVAGLLLGGLGPEDVIGITPFYRDHLLRYAGRAPHSNDTDFPIGYLKLECAPPSEEQKASLREKLGPLEGRFVLYFAGNLSKAVAEPFPHILDAAKRLRVSAPQVMFVMCGDGDPSAPMRRQASGFSNVKLPGHLSQEELQELRDSAEMGLLPIERRKDYQMSLSNKIFEYMSGRPAHREPFGRLPRSAA